MGSPLGTKGHPFLDSLIGLFSIPPFGRGSRLAAGCFFFRKSSSFEGLGEWESIPQAGRQAGRGCTVRGAGKRQGSARAGHFTGDPTPGGPPGTCPPAYRGWESVWLPCPPSGALPKESGSLPSWRVPCPLKMERGWRAPGPRGLAQAKLAHRVSPHPVPSPARPLCVCLSVCLSPRPYDLPEPGGAGARQHQHGAGGHN